MLCSITWYFLIDRGDSPAPSAKLTQACTVEGKIDAIGIWPKYGRKCVSRYDR
jgi:hypothetical protein